jgi:hypothetical protein
MRLAFALESPDRTTFDHTPFRTIPLPNEPTTRRDRRRNEACWELDRAGFTSRLLRSVCFGPVIAFGRQAVHTTPAETRIRSLTTAPNEIAIVEGNI